MAVDLTKYPDNHVRAFITAARLIAGEGTGWPQRFVQLVDAANESRVERDKLPTVSTSHLHNITAGKRALNRDLLKIILELGPEKIASMQAKIVSLQDLLDVVEKEFDSGGD